MMAETRIVLADGCYLFREGLRLIVESEPDLRVVAVAADGHEALDAVRREQPAVAVLDVDLPMLNGVETARLLNQEPFPPRVLCLSGSARTRCLWGAFSAGAIGYMLKEHSSDELIRAIRIVDAGETYISPKVAAEVVSGYVAHCSGANSSSRITQLTSRERQILQLVTEGIEGREAARRLAVSPKTIYSHLEHIMEKLSARSVADLTRHAVREGLTTL